MPHNTLPVQGATRWWRQFTGCSGMQHAAAPASSAQRGWPPTCRFLRSRSCGGGQGGGGAEVIT